MGTGKRIKAVRIARGLTQKQLGDLCGMADSAIRRYESDRGNPTEKTLKRIASALDIPVTDLLGRRDQALYDAGFKEGSEVEEWLNRQVDEAWAQEGYTHSERECDLIRAFSILNDEGQQRAVESVEIIAGNPKYQNQEKLFQVPPAEEEIEWWQEYTQEQPETAPKSPPAPTEGTDTTPPPDAPETPPEGK